MRRYIKAELFRNLKRPYFIILTGVVSGLAILLNLLLTKATGMVDSTVGIEDMVQTVNQMFSLPLFLVIMFVDMVTMEEFKNGTIKNIVSSGLSRDKIVVGKIITTSILGLVSAAVIILVHFISGFILINKSLDLSEMVFMKDLGLQLIGVIPLWIGSATLVTFFALIIDRPFVSGLFYYISVMIIPNVLRFLGLVMEKQWMGKVANNLFLNPVITNIARSSNLVKDMYHGVILGLGYIVVFTILSIFVFRKKDI